MLSISGKSRGKSTAAKRHMMNTGPGEILRPRDEKNHKETAERSTIGSLPGFDRPLALLVF